MRDDTTSDPSDEIESQGGGFRRRSLLKSAGAIGAAGALGSAATRSALADHVSEWPSPDDSYYSTLVDDLSGMDLPAAEFVYADNEADTASTYSLSGDVAESEALDVSGDDVPFSRAIRVSLTEEPENTYDVTYIAEAPDTAVSEGDVLLGIVYLRGPEESETTPTAQYVAKDEDNLSTNMVTSTAQVQPGSEWTRYYFPMEFSYDSEAGTWRTEMFLGFGTQTIDIGGMAVLHFADDTSPDQLPSGAASSGGQDSGGDWEAAADERIQEHRTADLTVEVTDTDGNPVEGADVEVAIQEHEFGFGTAISADHLVNNTAEGDTYREEIKRLFNTIVLGNFHKWRFWESGEGISDRATQWAIDQGMDIRGHVCLWGNVSSWAVPPDVVKAMGMEWEANGVTDPELDPDYVRQRTLEHIPRIIQDYGEHIEEWEVVNELVHRPEMVRAVNGVPGDQEGGLDVNPVEAPIVAEWYDAAREAAPEGTTLGVNDYNTLVGPYVATRNEYQTQIQFLRENSSLDSVGMQCHFSQNETLSPQQIMDGLDTYAQYDVTLQITEFDMADPNWAEEDKATFFRQFLKTVFSHRAVDEFLVWGIYSPLHWQDDAPFYAEGWEEKAPLAEYESLVFDEWWTEESGQTDENGTYATTGFKGEYEITASDGDVSRTVKATLPDGGTTVGVALDPDATPEPTPTPVEIEIDGTEVTTPEGGVGAGTGDDATTTTDDESAGSTTTDEGSSSMTQTTGGTRETTTDESDGDTPTDDGGMAADSPTDTETTSTDGQPGLGVFSGLAGLAGAAGLGHRLLGDEEDDADGS